MMKRAIAIPPPLRPPLANLINTRVAYGDRRINSILPVFSSALWTVNNASPAQVIFASRARALSTCSAESAQHARKSSFLPDWARFGTQNDAKHPASVVSPSNISRPTARSNSLQRQTPNPVSIASAYIPPALPPSSSSAGSRSILHLDSFRNRTVTHEKPYVLRQINEIRQFFIDLFKIRVKIISRMQQLGLALTPEETKFIQSSENDLRLLFDETTVPMLNDKACWNLYVVPSTTFAQTYTAGLGAETLGYANKAMTREKRKLASLDDRHARVLKNLKPPGPASRETNSSGGSQKTPSGATNHPATQGSSSSPVRSASSGPRNGALRSAKRWVKSIERQRIERVVDVGLGVPRHLL